MAFQAPHIDELSVRVVVDSRYERFLPKTSHPLVRIEHIGRIPGRPDMKRTLVCVVLAAAGLVPDRPVIAHHSFAAQYDANQQVTLKGTLLAPQLWGDPLGPYTKVLPLLPAMLVALAMLDEAVKGLR